MLVSHGYSKSITPAWHDTDHRCSGVEALKEYGRIWTGSLIFYIPFDLLEVVQLRTWRSGSYNGTL
jgi:hypothetical protein